MKFQLALLFGLVALACASPVADRQKRSYYYGAYSPYYYAPSAVAYASEYVGVPGFAARYPSAAYYSAPLVYVK